MNCSWALRVTWRTKYINLSLFVVFCRFPNRRSPDQNVGNSCRFSTTRTSDTCVAITSNRRYFDYKISRHNTYHLEAILLSSVYSMKTLVAKTSLWVSERLGPWASDEWRKIGNLKALHSGMFELIIMILDGFIKFFLIAVYSAFISCNINCYIQTAIRAKFVKKHHYMHTILCLASVLLNQLTNCFTRVIRFISYYLASF